MTMPQQNNMQFLDTNNPLVGGGPARIDTGIIQHPESGQMGVLTVRTPSTTLTVVMSPEDLRNWANHTNGLAEAMDKGGGTKLVPAGMGDVAAMDAMRRAGR